LPAGRLPYPTKGGKFIMNYNQATKFILSWAKLGRKEYLKDLRQCEVYLKRLQFFLDLIGNPEKQIPHYIHVTGTSGKGSVCLMLDSILRTSKKFVGTMTSPEIGPTQTRWQVNGQAMNNAEFAKILTELKPKLDTYLTISPYDPISHFELMTAIGLYWFAKKKIKWAILEVGCGGRYDSANVIPHKDIAVITNIGLDHTEILGKTKAKIAYEKSGIIKPGCKVFTMERDKKLLKIFEKEIKKYKKNTKQILKTLTTTSYKLQVTNLKGTIFKYQNNTYKLNTLGQHQVNNAILAIEVAKSLKISTSKIKLGLSKVKLPLRMEIISKKPLIILDGAHNPDKMETTVDAILSLPLVGGGEEGVIEKRIIPLFPPRNLSRVYLGKGRERKVFHQLHLLIAFSADKNITQMLKQLATLKPTSIAITKFQSPFKQAANPKDVEKLTKKYFKNTKIKTFNNPFTAFNWSKKDTIKSDILLITGSLYLAGEIQQKLTN